MSKESEAAKAAATAAVAEEKKPKPAGLFVTLAFLTIIGLILLTQEKMLSPDSIALGVCIFVGLGLVAVAAVLEDWIETILDGFKFGAFAWGGLIAIAGYFARVESLDEVNSIFHVDAGAFPLTVTAGMAMQMGRWMFWPFVLMAVGCVVACVVVYKQSTKGGETYWTIRSFVVAIVGFFCCSLAALFVGLQLSGEPAKTKLYRISHATDFSSSFRCLGWKEDDYDALFIGPEQRRVLFAPKIHKKSELVFPSKQPEMMQPLFIPDEFVIAECMAPPPPKPGPQA